MAFYDLPKPEREALVKTMELTLVSEFEAGLTTAMLQYFSDDDTYIRKAAYIIIGRLFLKNASLQNTILNSLNSLFIHDDFKVRQTVINAAGEIGKHNFQIVQLYFDNGLFDIHHSPRNAVIGSIKKMGEVNPIPVLEWVKQYLHHPDKEIRREICHGIELRGRKYPQDILPLLEVLQHDKAKRVYTTLVHVIGQIAYKKGCLETVIEHLKNWGNKQLVADALEEIVDVHYRYRNFSFYTQDEAKAYIQENYKQ
ncbi:MAG: HEAT repeat domain-containing protein [Flexibacteraceae bacterium]